MYEELAGISDASYRMGWKGQKPRIFFKETSICSREFNPCMKFQLECPFLCSS